MDAIEERQEGLERRIDEAMSVLDEKLQDFGRALADARERLGEVRGVVQSLLDGRRNRHDG